MKKRYVRPYVMTIIFVEDFDIVVQSYGEPGAAGGMVTETEILW